VAHGANLSGGDVARLGVVGARQAGVCAEVRRAVAAVEVPDVRIYYGGEFSTVYHLPLRLGGKNYPFVRILP